MDSSNHGQGTKRRRLDTTYQGQNANQPWAPGTAQYQNLTPVYRHVPRSDAPGEQSASMTYHPDPAMAPFTGHLEQNYLPQNSQSFTNTLRSGALDIEQTDFDTSLLTMRHPAHHLTSLPPHSHSQSGFELSCRGISSDFAPASAYLQKAPNEIHAAFNLPVSVATRLEPLVCFGMVSSVKHMFHLRHPTTFG
jgi:hypothetical protein